MNLANMIDDIAYKIAKQHARIIEDEIKKVLGNYNCKPEDLVIEYSGNAKIQINIKASQFTIQNHFIYQEEHSNEAI